jgi:hypothetical protein
MTELVIEPKVQDSADTTSGPIARGDRLSRPYATPVVASFALDSDGVDVGDALTANG